MKLAINGFGRIGRCFLRAVLERGKTFDCIAINDLALASTLAHLLKYDSTFGELDEDVNVEDNVMTISEMKIDFLSEKPPEKLPWDEMGVDLVVEATGIFRDREGASKHLDAGPKRS